MSPCESSPATGGPSTPVQPSRPSGARQRDSRPAAHGARWEGAPRRTRLSAPSFVRLGAPGALHGLGRSCGLEGPSALLARLPDLGDALRHAPKELKRQVFEAFCLQITYDKINRRIEISATITEAIADALENARDLPKEVSSVAQRDIAGAGFEPATFGL
jgi:hypothetical protein